jgi:hypothetical protein
VTTITTSNNLAYPTKPLKDCNKEPIQSIQSRVHPSHRLSPREAEAFPMHAPQPSFPLQSAGPLLSIVAPHLHIFSAPNDAVWDSWQQMYHFFSDICSRPRSAVLPRPLTSSKSCPTLVAVTLHATGHTELSRLWTTGRAQGLPHSKSIWPGRCSSTLSPTSSHSGWTADRSRMRPALAWGFICLLPLATVGCARAAKPQKTMTACTTSAAISTVASCKAVMTTMWMCCRSS